MKWSVVSERKPIKFTEHAVRRLLDLALTEDDVLKTIIDGKRVAEGKLKFKATLKTKKGLIIVTCAEYADHVRVITVGKRR